MTVQICGAGCKKCIKLTENLRKVIDDNNYDIEIIKITDYKEMLDLGVMSTPALLINDKIISTGKVHSTKQLEKILKENLC